MLMWPDQVRGRKKGFALVRHPKENLWILKYVVIIIQGQALINQMYCWDKRNGNMYTSVITTNKMQEV